MGNLISKMNFSIISTDKSKTQEYTEINQHAGNEVLFTKLVKDAATDYMSNQSSAVDKDGGGGLEYNFIYNGASGFHNYLKGHFYPKTSDFTKTNSLDVLNFYHVSSTPFGDSAEIHSSYSISYGFSNCMDNGVRHWSGTNNDYGYWCFGKKVLRIAYFNGYYLAFATDGIYQFTPIDNEDKYQQLKAITLSSNNVFSGNQISYDVYQGKLYVAYDGNNKIYSSSDGQTWNEESVGTATTIYSLVTYEPQHSLIVFTNEGIYVNGELVNTDIKDEYNVIVKASNGNIIFGKDSVDNSIGKILYVNGTTSFNETNLGTNGFSVTYMYKVGDTLLFCTKVNDSDKNGYLYYSNDNGVTWTKSDFIIKNGSINTMFYDCEHYELSWDSPTYKFYIGTTNGTYLMDLPLSDSGIHFDPEYLKAMEILNKDTISSEEVANNYILSDTLIRWLGYIPGYTGNDFTNKLVSKNQYKELTIRYTDNNPIKWGDYIIDNYENGIIKDGMRPYIKFTDSYDTTYKPITVLKTENMQGGGK